MNDPTPVGGHLPPEKLKSLLEGKLTGKERVEALDHVESCDACYQNLPEQTHDQVIDNLLGNEGVEEKLLENTTKLIQEKEKTQRNWFERILERIKKALSG